MESSTVTVSFGKSLTVPSVQNLAEECLLTIPPRYVRSDQEPPTVSDETSLLSPVPVIDLQRLAFGDSMDSELESLHSACKDWGFFQVVNHGVSADFLEEVKLEIESFFGLPYEEKKKLWQQPDNHEGFGQLFVLSEEQKLDWSDMFGITTLPSNLRKSDLFDKLPPKLRDVLETYAREMKKLALAILGHMAKALNMDAEEMNELFNDGFQSMRMNYYPPCPEPEKAIGFAPHSDADALTILFQLNETEGLQIRKEGRWVPVKPLPNAFVVYIGDIMERRVMESKPMLGTSLMVPSVKEMVKEQFTAIPPRYIRHDHDPSPVAHITSSLPQIPVIDMGKLSSQESMDHLELHKFHSACKEWGFFQVVNHGVSTALLEKVKLHTEEFFNLPMEEKLKFWQTPGELEGFGQHFVSSEEQKLEWADLFYVVTLPTHLRKPHLFSNFPPYFRDALEAYSEEVQRVAKKIFNLVAKTLGMEPDELKDLAEEGWQAMRMNCYPPCPQPDLVIGLKPHSDATGLTILLQLNDVEGLQIKKDGMWIPVKPIPNAFTINIGDMLEIVTNGTYRSIEHRATVSSNKERLSIATFHNPKFDGELKVAASLVTPEAPPLFKKMCVSDYFKGYFSRELHGKSFIEVLRIPNHQAKAN